MDSDGRILACEHDAVSLCATRVHWEARLPNGPIEAQTWRTSLVVPGTALANLVAWGIFPLDPVGGAPVEGDVRRGVERMLPRLYELGDLTAAVLDPPQGK